MKAINENEILKKVAYRLPVNICNKLEDLAVTNRRSINDELITILQDYFSMPVKWEPWIKKAIETYAETRNISYSWAANDLVSQKISDFEMVEGGIKSEIEKELEQDKPKKAAGQ